MKCGRGISVLHERAALLHSAVPAGSRPAQNVPCSGEGNRAEGGRKALPGSNGGVSYAERPKMYRAEAIISGPGYQRVYGETTEHA
jgi:hypothetical protein